MSLAVSGWSVWINDLVSATSATVVVMNKLLRIGLVGSWVCTSTAQVVKQRVFGGKLMTVFTQYHLHRIGDWCGRLAIPGQAVLHYRRRFTDAAPGTVTNQFNIGSTTGNIAGSNLAFSSVQQNFRVAQQYLILVAKNC